MSQKVQCSFHKCKNHMDVAKREVRAIRIRKGFVKDERGKTHIEWDGWRFICSYHDKFIKKRKLQPTLALIYGPKNKRNKGKKDKRHDKNSTKP